MKSYMERKYYLRGLGIGIAVTAIIMGIAASGKQTMTDEEVIARAKELGMVENTLLSDTLEEEQTEENVAGEDAAEQNAAVDSTGAGDGAAEQNDTNNTDAGNGKDGNMADGAATEGNDMEADKTGENITGQSGENSAAQSKLPGKETAGNSGGESENTDKNEDITSAAIKTITVTSGDGSYTVAKKLADVGVVTSAENFDTYLCQNGYDKKLRTGTFSIPADASDEQIARIVTGAE